ncbi:MAG: B12-binding domain-containing protein, partial [Bacteroidales bacterium]|nr:B12-binding domain-containing protein [Bacteroidales bacterium]
ETPVPPELKGQDGALEITRILLDNGTSPDTILKQSLIPGMDRIGDKYSQGKAFVPHLLLASRAMNASLDLLKPYFDSGAHQHTSTSTPARQNICQKFLKL